jgi:integrase/recombinase XerC
VNGVGRVVGLLGWGEAMTQYLMHLQAGGRSPGTVRLHRHYLGLLAARHRHPWTVSTVQLVAFMANPGWAPETRKSARTVMASFYRWGHASGHVGEDPALGLPPVKVPAGVPRPAPETVLIDALAGADLRMRLMLKLAAYAGLRAAEISRVHGTDLVGDVLLVRGKGGKVRRVPIMHPGLLRRLQLLGDAWAFPNHTGGPMTPGHVSRLVSAALPEGWTCHTLRHRMATVSYAGTRDLLAVGQLLGHSRPETTQRYVLLPEDALRAAALAAC